MIRWRYVKPSSIEGAVRGLVIIFHAHLNVDSVDDLSAPERTLFIGRIACAHG